MDTVVTRLTGEWTELTTLWAAATPPAADGETITVQPADAGSSHAIEVIQAASEPDAGERGHLLAGCDTLALAGVVGGHKHYGRSYIGPAAVVATGEGIAGGRGGGAGGGGLLLRAPPDEVSATTRNAAEGARDATIPDTTAFDANPNLAIILTVTAGADAGTVYQVRRGGAWADVTSVVRGPRGKPGTAGAGGSFERTIFQARAAAPPTPAIPDAVAAGANPALPAGWSGTPAAGDTPVWASLQRAARGSAVVTYTSPRRWDGEDGADGDDAPAAGRVQRAEVTLAAADLAGLGTARRVLLAQPAGGQGVVAHRLIIVKSGGPSNPPEIDDVDLWLALAPSAGGLITGRVGSPDWVFRDEMHRTGNRFGGPSGFVAAGDYLESVMLGRGISTGPTFTRGGGRSRSAWTGTPLVIAGYAEAANDNTSAQQWEAATTGLTDISLRLTLEYELVSI